MNALPRTSRTFAENDKERFVDSISAMLEIQMTVAAQRSVEDAAGSINGKALGYIYGFIDAALRTIGQDMSDEPIGIPITFHVLRRVFPGREEKYLRFLVERMARDPVVTSAAMSGGQQYIDFNNRKLAAPMGLARYILEQS